MTTFDSRCWVCQKPIPTQDGITICEGCSKAGVRFCWSCELWDTCGGRALAFYPRCPSCGSPMRPAQVYTFASARYGFVCCQQFIEEGTALPEEGPEPPREVGYCTTFEQRAALVSPEVADGRMKFYAWLARRRKSDSERCNLQEATKSEV